MADGPSSRGHESLERRGSADRSGSSPALGIRLDSPSRLIHTHGSLSAAAGSPIDVAAALSARGYREDGRLVIDVRDEFRPANTGTYELTVEGGKGSCSPTDAEPEIACTVHVVGGTYFGGVSWGTLARPGRLEERVQGAVARTDAMFRSDVAPRPIIHF